MTQKLLDKLPETTHEFSIDLVGETTRLPFKGNFTYKKPNLKAKAMSEKKRAELDGLNAESLDLTVQKLHFMVAYLKYSLATVPQWWEDADYGYALYDYNVVQEVFNECDKFETQWNNQVWGTKNVEEAE